MARNPKFLEEVSTHFRKDAEIIVVSSAQAMLSYICVNIFIILGDHSSPNAGMSAGEKVAHGCIRARLCCKFNISSFRILSLSLSTC